MTDLIHNPDRPMRVVAFASGSGTNFREAVLESREPGSNFSIDLLVTDKETKKTRDGRERIGALNYADEFGIDKITINGYRACGSWMEAQKTVEGIREYEKRCIAYGHQLLGKLQEYEREHGFTFDLAVLAGYMRLVKGPLLRRFSNNRAINIHPSHLHLNEKGERELIGANAVYDALAAGEKITRSTIITVDPETDAGVILASGPLVDYSRGEVTQDSADRHQDDQKEISDWPALRFTLRAIANGEIGLDRSKFHPDGNPVVVYQGKEMPYCGVDIGGI